MSRTITITEDELARLTEEAIQNAIPSIAGPMIGAALVHMTSELILAGIDQQVTIQANVNTIKALADHESTADAANATKNFITTQLPKLLIQQERPLAKDSSEDADTI